MEVDEWVRRPVSVESLPSFTKMPVGFIFVVFSFS